MSFANRLVFGIVSSMLLFVVAIILTVVVAPVVGVIWYGVVIVLVSSDVIGCLTERVNRGRFVRQYKRDVRQ